MKGGSLASPGLDLRGLLALALAVFGFSAAALFALRFDCQRRASGSSPTSSTVRPDFTDCGASSRMSRLRSACSSSDLISSQLSRFSPERGRNLTRCQIPPSLSPFNSKFDMPLLHHGGRIAVRRPGALVPDDHRTGAVIALGNDALERSVVDRVVLDMHGNRFSCGSRLGPRVTAQLHSTPPCSSLRS